MLHCPLGSVLLDANEQLQFSLRELFDCKLEAVSSVSHGGSCGEPGYVWSQASRKKEAVQMQKMGSDIGKQNILGSLRQTKVIDPSMPLVLAFLLSDICC